MADVGFLVLIAAFFGACVLYVRGADRMIEKARSDDGEHDAGISV